MIKNVLINIQGKVQNVGYRFSCMETAYKYNIKGFVRNRSDGSLSIEAEGKEEDLRKFVEWCKKGPMWARVKKFEISEGQVRNYETFEIVK